MIIFVLGGYPFNILALCVWLDFLQELTSHHWFRRLLVICAVIPWLLTILSIVLISIYVLYAVITWIRTGELPEIVICKDGEEE